MNKQTLTVMGVAVLGCGVGFVVGYKFAEKRLSDEFDRRLEKETAGMREFYQATKQPYATPQEAVAALVPPEVVQAERTAYHKIIKQENYAPKAEGTEALVDLPDQPPAAVINQNIFVKNERDPEIPYIISQDEFLENENGWQQITLTYYSQDNVLVDEREDPIEDIEAVIGEVALQNFGLQTSDARTVHVRNEKLGIEFEIVQNDGSYTKEVLGLDDPPPKLPSGRARSD